MTKITFQATSLRQLVKQMLPCAESKNINESKLCTLCVRERSVKLSENGNEEVKVLCATTCQPSFNLEVCMPLTTDRVEVDDELDTLGVRVNTRDLDNALGSFGQQMVTLAYGEGCLCLSTYLGTDEQGNKLVGPMKTLSIRSELVEMGEEDDEEEFIPDCILASSTTLIEGLRAVAHVASERGNGPQHQMVEVIGMPDSITFQAHHPNAESSYCHPDPWNQPLRKAEVSSISPDSARHLVSALVNYGFHEPVEIQMNAECMSFNTAMVKMEVF